MAAISVLENPFASAGDAWKLPGSVVRIVLVTEPSPAKILFLVESNQPTTPRANWQLLLLICAVLIAATVTTFWPAKQCGFVDWDDQYFVAANPHVKPGLTWAGVKWAMTSDVCANWHPVTMLSHMVDCQLFGVDPGMHHLSNVFLHAINVALLFLLLRRLTGAVWRSAAVAAIFAVHPLRVESVAWISERKDVLCVMFFLLTIWAYASWAERRGTWRYLRVLGCYTLALMSKPMAVTLPLVLLLLDFWPLERVSFEQFVPNATKAKPKVKPRAKEQGKSIRVGRLVYEKLPLFGLAVALSIVTYLMQKSDGVVAPSDDLPLTFRLTNPFISYWRYIGKTFWPADLSPIYIRTQPWPLWLVGVALIGLVGVSIVAMIVARRRPYITIGWFFFLGTLVPVIGFVQAGSQCMADRYTYIPSIGLLIAVVWSAWELKRVPKVVWIVAVLGCVAACSVRAYNQCFIWRNTETLFERPAAETDHVVAHNALGLYYFGTGQFDKAEAHYRRAIEVQPKYAESHNNYGILLAKLGRNAEALDNFEAAVRITPQAIPDRMNLAHGLFEKGDFEGALVQYNYVLQREPETFDALHSLGACYDKLNNPKNAAECFRKALAVQPDNAVANASLGRVLFAMGNIDEALSYYSQSVSKVPTNPATQLQLGLLLAIKDKPAEAETHIREALRLNPASKEAQEALELLIKSSKRGE